MKLVELDATMAIGENGMLVPVDLWMTNAVASGLLFCQFKSILAEEITVTDRFDGARGAADGVLVIVELGALSTALYAVTYHLYVTKLVRLETVNDVVVAGVVPARTNALVPTDW